MRLINTVSLLLEEFFDAKIPAYSILSHTWADAEVSYQEWIYAQNQRVACMPWGFTRDEDEVERIKEKSGFVKIVKACRQAERDGFLWIWVDTVCIDKTSSAELSEAINSMYQWYELSDICFVYLEDVPAVQARGPILAELATEDSHFRRSRWFTRGWTLQELLAPSELFFLSQAWTPLGTLRRALVGKDGGPYVDSFGSLISRITGIKTHHLYSRSGFVAEEQHACIAEKMSWASRRKTTRIEDMAYSLLGLFRINMPLLYGEGARAFGRLQEEIIKRSTDKSILAWRKTALYQLKPGGSWRAQEPQSLLAPSVECFAETFVATHARGFITWTDFDLRRGYCAVESGGMAITNHVGMAITNLGVHLRAGLIETLASNFFFAIPGLYRHTELGRFGEREDSTSETHMAIPLHTGGPILVPPLARCNFPASFVELHLSASTASVIEFTDLVIFNDLTLSRPLGGKHAKHYQWDNLEPWGSGAAEGVGIIICFPLGRRGFQCESPMQEPYLPLIAVNEAQTLFHGSLHLHCEDGEGSLTDVDIMFAVRTSAGGTPKTWGCEVLEGETAPLNEDGGSEEMAKEMAEGRRPWQRSSAVKGARIVMENRVYRGEMMARHSTPSKHSVVIASLFLTQ
jgi:hypothetical protein